MAERVTVETLLDHLDPTPPESEVLSCFIVIRQPTGLVQTLSLGRFTPPVPIKEP